MTTNPDYCEVPLSLQYFEGLNKTKKRKLRRKKTTQLLEETQEQKKHTPSDNFKKTKAKEKQNKKQIQYTFICGRFLFPHFFLLFFCFSLFSFAGDLVTRIFEHVKNLRNKSRKNKNKQNNSEERALKSQKTTYKLSYNCMYWICFLLLLDFVLIFLFVLLFLLCCSDWFCIFSIYFSKLGVD